MDTASFVRMHPREREHEIPIRISGQTQWNSLKSQDPRVYILFPIVRIMLYTSWLGPISAYPEQLLKYPIVITCVVLYQGLFSAKAVRIPNRLQVMFENSGFRFVSLLMIALAAVQDIEVAILSVFLFLFVLYLIKTPEERKEDGFV